MTPVSGPLAAALTAFATLAQVSAAETTPSVVPDAAAVTEKTEPATPAPALAPAPVPPPNFGSTVSPLVIASPNLSLRIGLLVQPQYQILGDNTLQRAGAGSVRSSRPIHRRRHLVRRHGLLLRHRLSRSVPVAGRRGIALGEVHTVDEHPGRVPHGQAVRRAHHARRRLFPATDGPQRAAERGDAVRMGLFSVHVPARSGVRVAAESHAAHHAGRPRHRRPAARIGAGRAPRVSRRAVPGPAGREDDVGHRSAERPAGREPAPGQSPRCRDGILLCWNLPRPEARCVDRCLLRFPEQLHQGLPVSRGRSSSSTCRWGRASSRPR